MTKPKGYCSDAHLYLSQKVHLFLRGDGGYQPHLSCSCIWAGEEVVMLMY